VVRSLHSARCMWRTITHRLSVTLALALAPALGGCDADAAGGSRAAGGADPAASDASCPLPEIADAGPRPPPMDDLSPTRRLRRLTLALTDRLPTRERLRELAAITDPTEQSAWIDREIERLLAEPAFYDAMVELGHMWMNIPAVGPIADSPEYGLVQQRAIARCPEGTLHAGAWTSPNGYAENQPCNGLSWDGTPAVVRTIEPWWAEGTTVQVVGIDGDERTSIPGPDGTTIDCGVWNGAGFDHERQYHCGCGPNLVYCTPGGALQDYLVFHTGNPDGNRRQMWDEPARLLAHIAWHDRPLTDLIAGTYSVGPASAQATYVRYGRRLGATQLDADQSWWRASTWTAPHDPHHDATDPRAWSEFEIPARNPYLLAERDYRFDPRTEASGTMRGVPAAGVLTMPGVLASLTRERVRGARFLEMFACENFVPPPPTAHFAPYTNDPAAGGPCMHCHSRIDPASIHFKRFVRNDSFQMLGIGNAHTDPRWLEGEYPYHADPWDRIRRLWAPETRMTPVPAAIADAEPESRFIDFLPPDQTLYGQVSDGTVGPLGMAKMIIAAGAFDRCVVRRLHERFAGRDIDPTAETGYLETLVRDFVAGGRAVRPFVRHLVHGEIFGRGL
jgi:hypothetical protein